MKTMTTMIIALTFAALGCGDRGRTGSETHWLSCDTTNDCNEGFVCSGGRCLPEDELPENNSDVQTNNATSNDAGSNNATSNNATSNNATSNNATSNNSTNASNNQTNVCPLTGEPVPVEVDAVHDVTFELTNNYATDIWIPEQGWFCTPWGIDAVELAIGFKCGCECPAPGSPGVMMLRQVPVGETVTVTWDGRELVTYTECIACADTPLYETAGVLQPLAAGTYTFRMPVALDQLPMGCIDNGDQTATCDPSLDPTGELPRDVALTCEVMSGSTVDVTQQFDLPASGPLTVPVSMP